MKSRIKKCIECGNEYTKPPKVSWRLWNDRKYCSKKCQGAARGVSQIGEKNHMWGKTTSQCQKSAVRESNKGDKHHLWKGNGVSYSALHNWVRRWKGTPDTCEHCGKSGLEGKDIQWANIDGEYKRILNDYIRLCAKCHWHYDRDHESN